MRKNNHDLVFLALTVAVPIAVELVYRLGIDAGLEKASSDADLPAADDDDGDDSAVAED